MECLLFSQIQVEDDTKVGSFLVSPLTLFGQKIAILVQVHHLDHCNI